MYRRIHFFALLLSALLLLALPECTGIIRDKPDNKMPDTELIEKTIHNSLSWAKNKDFNLLYSVIANDTNYLEVHPDGTIVRGFSEFKKAESYWRSPDFRAIRYEIRDLDIRISLSGKVAWWCCILDDVNEWKGQPASWIDTRWTGVLEKRDGRWIIIQMHFSLCE